VCCFAFGASELPRLDSVPFFDVRVLGFALAALVTTALLVGFAPALRLAGTSLKTLMNESGRSSTGGGATHRTLNTMIVAEIALAITLVAGAGWLVRSFANLDGRRGFVSKADSCSTSWFRPRGCSCRRDHPCDGGDDRRAPVGVDARARSPPRPGRRR
jgi:hypothetical protein